MMAMVTYILLFIFFIENKNYILIHEHAFYII